MRRCTVETQRKRYNPGGFIGLMQAAFTMIKLLITQEKPDFCLPGLIFPMWRVYKIMSKELEKQHGELELTNTFSLIQKVYNGNADLLMKIMGKLGNTFGYLSTWNQWVACPETGDMLVSFSKGNKFASENQVYHFNLYKLLE